MSKMIFAPTVSWSIAWLSIFFIKICFWLKYIYRYETCLSVAEKKRISPLFWFLWHDSWQIKKSHKFVMEWLFVFFTKSGESRIWRSGVIENFLRILFYSLFVLHSNSFYFWDFIQPISSDGQLRFKFNNPFCKTLEYLSHWKEGSSSAIHN